MSSAQPKQAPINRAGDAAAAVRQGERHRQEVKETPAAHRRLETPLPRVAGRGRGDGNSEDVGAEGLVKEPPPPKEAEQR